MKFLNKTASWFILASFLSFPAPASDLQREARWANEIADAILVGESVWLEAGNHRFLAIYTEPSGDVRHGAVILVHGVGVHPDWPEVINPLRERLPEHGWATLSLQMPVLEAEAGVSEYYRIFPEALPRIDAGMRYLREQGYKTVVVAGHSLGSEMAAYWVSQSHDTELKGFIAIGLSGAERTGYGDTLGYLAKITVPTLDIFGEHDLRTVNKTTAARLAAAKRAGNTGYVQVEVAGANHMFRGSDAPLVDEAVKWLEGVR
jgi:pimeloyl-ACP methyl ester carboxylesterase